MKNLFILVLLFTTKLAISQVAVQPISSGNYWQTNEYKTRIYELASSNSFPTTVNFSNGYVGFSDLRASRLIGANEIVFTTSNMLNVSGFVVEWSRDLNKFEPAGLVQVVASSNGYQYIFRHSFLEDRQIYYRIGIVSLGKTIAYTPAVQVATEINSTKIFPTQVKGNTFYVQAGEPYQKLQVVSSNGVVAYEKGLDNLMGTITIGLPPLPSGIYFVRLLSNNKPQRVERIFIDRL